MSYAGADSSSCQKKNTRPLGRQATPAERKHKIAVNDHIVDWATTLLAALRLGMDEEQLTGYQRGLADGLSSAGQPVARGTR